MDLLHRKVKRLIREQHLQQLEMHPPKLLEYAPILAFNENIANSPRKKPTFL